MLPPDSRAVLLDHLRPSAGYSLGGAIATTFTLSLPAAVIPPLAFSAFTGTGSPGQDPISQLEAVRSAANRIDVFCQAGNIAMPAKAADLFAFVEPMVHGVRRPPNGLFHPKIWFIRYDPNQGGSSQYRLLVLTRNLTHDRTWDVVVRLDSAAVEKRVQRENAPLAALLSSLPERAVTPMASARATRVSALADEARRISWEHPESIGSLDFHYLAEGRGLDLSGHRHLVISPFLNDAGLRAATRHSRDITVLSRVEELEQLEVGTAGDITAYVLDEMAGIDSGEGVEEATHAQNDGAEVAPAAGAGSLLNGLHAKVYVVEPDARQRPRLLIGSANATDAAFGSNVEFMVEFRGARKDFGIDRFVGPEGSLAEIIREYQVTGGQAPDPAEEEQFALENALRSIAEIHHVITVTKGATATAEAKPAFSLMVATDRAYSTPSDWKVTVGLLTRPGLGRMVESSTPLAEKFEGVEKADITPFLCVSLTAPSGLSASTVLVGELHNDPEDRLDVVLARQIDTPEKFLRFLYLLLSLGNLHWLAQLEAGSDSDAAKSGPLLGSGRGPGILELVLQGIATNPSALDDLDGLVRRLTATEEGRHLLPEGFEQLWSAVSDARADMKRTRS
ncbi:hypothetical protein N802_11385 [Knoellia sinensis KCTC 19936]|uniref:PLD phosphodiesterase domain-containing protein n=1 Tax=Knoellia sinensis KCTC 19936 TaxID=1385520 RepID=A0A0A0IYA2_9MICO|nr:phospholipase D family protein [Knoellia sinensis]KGN29778.1 hypothetical protein N802_11385 [Knoellia sinensis KCTC 19936]